MFKKMTALCMMLGLCLSLSACGNRPAQITHAPDADKSAYPVTYPNPATDPSL